MSVDMKECVRRLGTQNQVVVRMELVAQSPGLLGKAGYLILIYNYHSVGNFHSLHSFAQADHD